VKPDNLYIILILSAIAVDFALLGDRFPSSILHTDHTFHILKFELFSKYGLSSYEELGGISYKLLFPPLLMPFLLLGRIIPPRLAYFMTYGLVIAIWYFIAKKLVPGREKTILLAVLFPICTFGIIKIGRLLELMAHLPLLILFANLDNPKKFWSSVFLFIAGMVSHLPVTVFYFPILALKCIEKKRFNLIFAWLAVTAVWLAVYFPMVEGTVGTKVSRMEVVTNVINAALKNEGFGWAFPLIFAISVYALACLPSFGREGLYAVPSFIVSTFPPLAFLSGIPVYDYLPGVNQIIITNQFPFFAYLLQKKNPKVWKILFALLLPFAVIPLPWNGATENDFPYLDNLTGNYSIVHTEEGLSFASNYLAHRGVFSPFCSTWEYSDPYWFYYNPESCEEINRTVKYTIFPRTSEWTKECGNYTLTPNLIILETS
jgi:hypothetical protein